ncbi:MAG: nucleoside phosphorylase [Clostridiaceae bacterium]|nr:nucleoside phosphorylase [Clostridiaceae bacterium]MBW4859182.1 nucleoside phosphorylase [Clostridiaceae bacterium]MBW4868678.1 nucleoside phosphorylase [Clostridiaceae bacterium]
MLQPHILCNNEDISEYVILPGDPQRATRVAEGFLEDWEEIAFNREFKTITGKYKGVLVTITSTGIGGPSTAIAIEELIACGAKYFIRIGSGGAVQSNISLGDLIIATAAVREDGASKMYVESEYPAVSDVLFTNHLIETCKELKFPYHYGIVRSHDSFYTDSEDEIMEYWNEKKVLASDMETSTLLSLAQLKGVKAASVLNTVVEYESDLKDGVADYVAKENICIEGEKREIKLALETIYKIDKLK